MSRPLFIISTIWLAALSWVPLRAGQSTGVPLVADGQPRAVIVVPVVERKADSASLEAVTRMNDQAAKLLADHLLRMSGAKLPILREDEMINARVVDGRLMADKPKAESFILIGDSALARQLGVSLEGMKPGGTLLQTRGNTLVMTGVADSTLWSGGSVYAAIQFLESLGVRYLWPGELGLVVPRNATVMAQPVEYRFTPIIAQRNFRSHHPSFDRIVRGGQMLGLSKEYLVKQHEQAANLAVTYMVRGASGGWEQWQRLGGDVGIVGGHAFGKLWEEQGQTHPEWFALQPNGSRAQKSSGRARLCVSNPGLIEHIANEIIERIRKTPGVRTVSLSPNDGGQDAFCMCDACQALDAKDGPPIKGFRGWNRDYVSLTDRYVYFWNAIAERVAKVHPNLLFTIDAYSYYSDPPVRRALHPNMVVRYVPPDMSGWDAWRKGGSKIYWRPNIFAAPWAEGTLLFSRQNAADMRFAAHNGALATDFDSILHNWSTHGLLYYVMARLNWDPDQDVDAIIDDYCQAGFGPAGPAVRDYFRGVEKLMSAWDPAEASRNRDRLAISHRVDPFAAACTPQRVAEMRRSLDAAAAAAGADAAIKARVAFLRTGLDWSDMQAQAYRVLIDYRRGRNVDLVAADRLLKRRGEMMQRIAAEQPLAVNVAYVTFGDKGRWAPLEQVAAKAAQTAPKPASTMKTVIDADEEGRPVELPATK